MTDNPKHSEVIQNISVTTSSYRTEDHTNLPFAFLNQRPVWIFEEIRDQQCAWDHTRLRRAIDDQYNESKFSGQLVSSSAKEISATSSLSFGSQYRVKKASFCEDCSCAQQNWVVEKYVKPYSRLNSTTCTPQFSRFFRGFLVVSEFSSLVESCPKYLLEITENCMTVLFGFKTANTMLTHTTGSSRSRATAF
jgi:hypothetical protein